MQLLKNLVENQSQKISPTKIKLPSSNGISNAFIKDIWPHSRLRGVKSTNEELKLKNT